MATRFSMKIITATEATDEGTLIVKGSGRRGDTEVELPGEAAEMLIASLIALRPKLSKVSPSGSRPSFQMAGFELRDTNEPGTLRLYMRCALPASAAPDAEIVDIGFSISWDQVAEMGEKLSEAAKKRPPVISPTRN